MEIPALRLELLKLVHRFDLPTSEIIARATDLERHVMATKPHPPTSRKARTD